MNEGLYLVTVRSWADLWRGRKLLWLSSAQESVCRHTQIFPKVRQAPHRLVTVASPSFLSLFIPELWILEQAHQCLLSSFIGFETWSWLSLYTCSLVSPITNREYLHSSLKSSTFTALKSLIPREFVQWVVNYECFLDTLGCFLLSSSTNSTVMSQGFSKDPGVGGGHSVSDLLGHCFLSFNVHIKNFLKYRFWFSSSGMELENFE